MSQNQFFKWKTLLPTYQRRLTAIEGLHVSNITVGDAKFLCLVKAEREAPVRNVSVRNVKVVKVGGTPVTTENVEGFVQA